MAVYTLSQVLYLSPFIQDYFVSVASLWWGVAVSRLPTGVLSFVGGHWEMLRPSFFIVFAVPPILVSLILIELARDHVSRRVASRSVMHIGALVRRKPRVFGSLSPFGYGELLFLFALLGGNVVLFWYGWIYTRQYVPLPGEPYTFDTVLQITGIVFGYSCVFNMAFLFLPSTRNCAWMEFLDISYTNGVKYHRWLGVATLVTGVAHAMPFYWLWARLGTIWEMSLPCFDCALDYSSKGYGIWFNVFGEISLFFLLLVGVTSIPWVRRKMFETFYYTHHLYILGVVFAVMHWVTCIWWFLPTLVVYLISRAISTWNALHPVQVVEFTALADDIVKIVLTRSTTTGGGGEFQIGQFVYLNVPAISKLQWHAFTISSSPRSSATTFTVLLKSLGDWTRDLVVLAEKKTNGVTLVNGSKPIEQQQQQTTMLVDGFYGSSLQCYDEFSTLCLVGGGIGVTPLFAILEDILATLSGSDKNVDSQTCHKQQRVHFVFSFRELSLLEEIHPVLSKLKELDSAQQHFTTHFFLTRAPSDAALNTRIDYDRLCNSANHNQSSSVAKSTAALDSALYFAPQPFAEPLRSRRARIIVYVVTLCWSTLLVLWLEFGGGKLMQSGTQWWPLENFVEISVVFVIPVLVSFVALVVDTKVSKWGNMVSTSSNTKRQSLFGGHSDIQNYQSVDMVDTLSTSSMLPINASDVVTFGDLLSEYNVTIGKRPDMARILTQMHSEFKASGPHLSSNSALEAQKHQIGVFISGPEALKSATEEVVSKLGAHDFDIHEEEFEL
uniref:FAD-binding FR-type domain-containing protein n=1 Tax=Globisporangium ultimum (strain ATCC 200006 / CBS 805.95 / DAOM BR144) TaxID=431595 RepID=K3WU66_GLOUD